MREGLWTPPSLPLSVLVQLHAGLHMGYHGKE
jgi:hypothetical protein